VLEVSALSSVVLSVWLAVLNAEFCAVAACWAAAAWLLKNALAIALAELSWLAEEDVEGARQEVLLRLLRVAALAGRAVERAARRQRAVRRAAARAGVVVVVMEHRRVVGREGRL
jgi:hypothetical protein